MRKACLVVPFLCQKNRIFDLSDSFINRDGCMVPFAMLKEKFATCGYDLATSDINTIDDSECVIYLEMPTLLPKSEHVEKSFLLIYETELILPRNWDLNRHRSFKKIFTWNDALIDNKKYFKMNWSHVFPENTLYDSAEKTKFCCVIASNKASNHELELYSKRVEAIRWFEKRHPDKFDLYGVGWNEIRLPGNQYFEKYWLLRLFKRGLSLFAPRFPSYKGKVVGKLQTLRQYRYSICYENARDFPGYITEKIFDCFFAACIPVYWGPDNIASHISPDCFIDKRNFSSYEELYRYLSGMSEFEFSEYIAATARYLKSSAAKEFTVTHFVDILAKEILTLPN